MVFPFRYAQEGVVKQAPKAQATRGGGSGAYSLRKVLFLGPRK